MKMQNFSFVLIRFNKRSGRTDQITDREMITIYGEDEDDLFRKADKRLREIADEAGPGCDPDDIQYGKVRECTEDDLLSMKFNGENRRWAE